MDLSPLSIGARLVGPGEPCFVIAEAGVNHNGAPELAEQLVVAAARAGADCVKFQTFAADRVASRTAEKPPYQLRGTDVAESQLDMLRRLELRPDDHQRLLAACEREGVLFLSTPYSIEDVDLLESLAVPAYKVASALIVEPELLRRLAATGKPLILSTGLADLEEVAEAVDVVRASGNGQLVVLQCTTEYPADVSDANLRAMQTMRESLGVLTGYSDHTQGATAAIAAVALGAVVVEKHFTLDATLPGPDQATSATPDELEALVRSIREVEAALGNGRKEPRDVERANLVNMRRSLVARVGIPRGTRLTRDMIATKRPATGIAPRDIEDVLGRTASVEIEADRPIERWMLA
jgi:N-acetylneuraminate synthase/N,N'-diacetyllegionaminate synthase